jgi:hypothetical protein
MVYRVEGTKRRLEDFDTTRSSTREREKQERLERLKKAGFAASASTEK